MSRPPFALPAVALALGLGALRPAAAQPVQQGAPVTVPHRTVHPAWGRATGFDCAVESLSMVAYPRRLMAFVDVAVKVRGIRGGFCAVRPDGVQVQATRLSGAASRFAALFVEDGRPKWPGEVTEYRSVSDRLEPWVGVLEPNETRTVVFRGVFEMEQPAKGEPELPSKLRVQFSNFGPRVVPGAPADLRIVLEPNVQTRVLATTLSVNKKATEPVAGTTFQVHEALDRENLIPLIEWRYEAGGPPAPTAANALGSALSLFEYLRFGMVRDLTTAYATKDAKRIAAAWDESLDLAFAAARSEDELVAGLGLRAFAWLANGLNATAWRVRSASEGAGGDDTVVVPDAIAADLAKVLPNFQRAIGNWEPPSPVGARGARVLAASLGDPGDNKKAAGDAMGRLVRRLDQARARRAPVLFKNYPLPAFTTRPLDASRLIEFRPSGPKLVSAFGGSSAPAGAPSRRLIRALTHPRKAWKPLLGLAVIAGAAAGLAYALRGARRQQTSTV